MWTTLEHNGIYFPPLYTPLPNDIKLLYDGKPVLLTIEQEEPAYLYSKYLNTEYTENSKFNKNFFKDWLKILGKDHIIKDFTKVDFTPIYNYILKLREKKLNLTKEEKLKIKEEKDKLLEPYKYCIVDNIKQPVGNYIVEPPELFKGRGNHPKSGMIKKRIKPEDVTINISLSSKLPIPNVPGKWGRVIEDHSVMWLASWKEEITGKMKYVFLSQESDIRMSKDKNKFELARKLRKKIKNIRKKYLEDLKSPDIKTRQIASAIYLIDKLALRVGNEKSDEQVETVGVSSLKVGNINIYDDCKLELDFLGKDSIRYQNIISVSEDMCKNIKEFEKNKEADEDLFDLINSTLINNYLTSLMKNLTAKVFRTYNASYLFYKALKNVKEDLSDIEKLELYNKANINVATLCNHKKKVSKNFKEQLSKIDEQIKELKSKQKKTKKQKEKIKQLKLKKELKKELKELSLGTSKINYIDPRITVAYFKKHNLNIEKVFTKTLLNKFKWALVVDKDWKY